jgi:hypothetical protein
MFDEDFGNTFETVECSSSGIQTLGELFEENEEEIEENFNR